MDAIDGVNNRVVTECGHAFHCSCLMKNAVHNGFGCPYCRTKMAEEIEEDDDSDDDTYVSYDTDDEEEDEEDDDEDDDDDLMNSYYRGDEELFVSDGRLSEQYNLIMSNIYNSISNYIRDVNIPEFTYWQGYTPFRFNRYKENQTMLKHIDRIKSIFDGTRRGVPLLSVVGLLNDNFSGGDFIMFDDYKVNLKAGDIMIFPSSFTFPHHVTHITEGTRYSFVSWVW
jgi:hypothetical protein